MQKLETVIIKNLKIMSKNTEDKDVKKTGHYRSGFTRVYYLE